MSQNRGLFLSMIAYANILEAKLKTSLTWWLMLLTDGKLGNDMVK